MKKVRRLMTLLMATLITAGQFLVVVNDTAAGQRKMEHDPSSV